ncbi:LOW QUALITY PROTEIN: hypothetical protein ACHAXR_007658, partial [Thalassiosira sp. AJA248-18]
LLTGFSPTPPGREISGTYRIVSVTAVRYDTDRHAYMLIGWQPNKWASLIIEETTQRFSIDVNGRRVTDEVLFGGQVALPSLDLPGDPNLPRPFHPLCRFYGFCADSMVTMAHPPIPTNASLLLTKQNIKLNAQKLSSFNETCAVLTDESFSIDFQEHETSEARRICNCRHYSFLCRKLGLTCSASALITLFAIEYQPFIFAEPGDIWIDIHHSMRATNTYVLARRERGTM